MLIGAGSTITAGVKAAVPVPAPTYAVYQSSDTVDEGGSILYVSATTGVPDGTRLYWSIQHGYTSNADFVDVGGSFTVINGAGSFLVQPLSDNLTEGSEDFYVAVRTGSSSGPIVATSLITTIIDTSLNPPAHGSVTFDGSTDRSLQLGATAAWALGNTCTIEFWIKPRISSLDAPGQFLGGIMSQHNGGGSGIDVFQAGGVLNVADGSSNYSSYPEPLAGIWSHVAIVFPGAAQNMKVFINGKQQTQAGGNGGSGQFSNTTDGLTIGKRGPTVPYQFYDGKITNVRISTTALYSSDFVPALLPTRNIGTTALLWTPTDQSITTDIGDNALSIINNNSVTYSSEYPAKLTTYHPTAYGGPNATFSPLPPVQTGWTIIGTVSGSIVWTSTVTNPSYYGNIQAADAWPLLIDNPPGTVVTYAFIG